MEELIVLCDQDCEMISGEIVDFPGCFTQGRTQEEFKANLISALACHLDCDERHVKDHYKFSFVME